MKGYLYLGIAIIAEIVATMFLKLSEGFTVLVPSLIVIIGYVFSFYCLGKTLAFLPLSLTYAIWSGVGTALTAVLGVILFDDPVSVGVILGIMLIIGGVVFLNASPLEREEKTI